MLPYLRVRILAPSLLEIFIGRSPARRCAPRRASRHRKAWWHFWRGGAKGLRGWRLSHVASRPGSWRRP
eukprot:15470062-Alexandrium_andersonii.AAC.1